MRSIRTISLVAISALALSAGIAQASTPTAAHATQLTHEAQPGDDKGGQAKAQPGDDKGGQAEPGDDKGGHHHRGGHGSDD